MKRAIITGVTGQDGSYLTEFLLNKGYEVFGLVRRASTFNTVRIDHLLKDRHEKNVNFFRQYGDLSDYASLQRFFYEVIPDEIYHLGAQSHVRVSFHIPEYTADVTGIATLRILEIIRDFESKNPGKKIKFYQAASSEMFGGFNPPQNETTSFHPRSPYGCAKVFAYHSVVNYREAYNIFACNGILFNHESPRRGPTFVTRKIARGVVAIERGEIKTLFLGNLDAKRDWGYAPEYVEAMWMMLQESEPDDYVIATGKMHTVREFVEKAFRCINKEVIWHGTGVDEKGLDKKTGDILIALDKTYFRPSEVNELQGDYSKAEKKLGWKPKTTFDELVKIMVNAERDLI